MLRMTVTVLAALLAGTSIAAPRPSTLNMTCAEAAATVASRGAVVLRTAPHLLDRYVLHTGFCMRDEYAKNATVPTLDVQYCAIGYTCEQRHGYSPGR